jgi:DNA-binding MarR family transcriptional regulator
MNPRGEARQIVTVIRTLMKRRGLLYKDLAEVLDVSLPTVKRLMTDCDMSLDRLLRVCDWLELTVHQLFAMVSETAGTTGRFTEEQEKFFAENPEFLAYFWVLHAGRKKPGEIEKTFSLTKYSTHRYLQALEEIGLIERMSEERIKIKLTASAIVWDDRGTLGRMYTRHFLNEMTKRAIKQLDEPADLFLDTGGRWLTDKNITELKVDFADFVKKYRVFSDLNKASGDKETHHYVSYLFIADKWVDPLFSTVTEVS